MASHGIAAGFGPRPFRLAGSAIRVRTQPMLRINGYGDDDRVPPQVSESAKRMAARAEALFEPAVVHRLFNIESVDAGVLTLENGATLEAAEFAGTLADCCAIVIAVLALGGRLDREAQALAVDRNGIDLLLFETAGWLGIEELNKAFAAHLRVWAEGQGLRLTRRLAPGYDKWPLTGQRSLFGLLDGTPLPVRLLESCAMTPAMSRSALYGVRRQPQRQSHLGDLPVCGTETLS
jgi:hypothetical protein